MANASIKFFAGFFGVIALAIVFVRSNQTPAIIGGLGNGLAQLGSSLESGNAPVTK